MSVPLSILYLLIINLMEFLKVWAKHNFYYIRYISVYIQPRYFYLIFRSVNGNNMNRVILHSVRPSFWKKRAFSPAPRCGSTESGCEISVPWWLILADRGKMTSVWSRDRDTGDTNASRFGPFPVRPLSRSASYPFGPLVYISHQVRGVVGDMACWPVRPLPTITCPALWAHKCANSNGNT